MLLDKSTSAAFFKETRLIDEIILIENNL